MTMIAALYFTQGFPISLSMEALPVMMRQAGVSLDIIAFVPLASLPWVVKLFLAPLVDKTTAFLGWDVAELGSCR